MEIRRMHLISYDCQTHLIPDVNKILYFFAKAFSNFSLYPKTYEIKCGCYNLKQNVEEKDI